jgi:hypothetical protein
MKFEPGNRINVESESTERPHRTGVIKEVVGETPSPRYLVQWDDGHESIYAPAAGAAGLDPASEEQRPTAG